MRLAALDSILQPLFEGAHRDPFLTLCFPEDGTLFQLLYEGGALHLYLNTSGDAGSLEELRLAVEDLDLEVGKLDGHEGTEHVTIRGSESDLAERALQVVSAVFGKSRACEVEIVDSFSRLGSESSDASVPDERARNRPAGAAAPKGGIPFPGRKPSGSGGPDGREVPMRWPLAVSSLGLMVAGALAVGGAMVHSRLLGGQWLGDPLPTPTEVALGLGGMVFIFGAAMGAYWGILQITDRTALGDLLHRPLVGDNNRLARIATRLVRGIGALERGVDVLVLLGGVALLLWLAFHDALIAWILGITAALLVVIYWVAYWISRGSGPG